MSDTPDYRYTGQTMDAATLGDTPDRTRLEVQVSAAQEISASLADLHRQMGIIVDRLKGPEPEMGTALENTPTPVPRGHLGELDQAHDVTRHTIAEISATLKQLEQLV